MNPPVLSIQTVYFDDSDLAEATRFGQDLYENLTRPQDDPLSSGPGIPVRVAVRWDLVDPRAADTTVLIPVLGSETYQTMVDDVVSKLNEWHAICGEGHVLPVPLSTNWRAAESRLPGKQLLTMLYGAGDLKTQTFDEIVLAISRIWEPENGGVKLFISHAKMDIPGTGNAAEEIHDHVVTDTTGSAFFDVNDLHSGENLSEQLDQAAGQGVLISIRGDSYSSRAWCQKELLRAKLRGVPTLTVELLKKGEHRSFPYGGNSPGIVWDGNPARVASRAMIEWLRAAYFRKEAARIIEAADLPDDVCIVARPPELLDLAQGPLIFESARLVLHPDPELTVLERKVLKDARPRMHLATPTTAFRRLLSRGEETATVTSPLEGKQVAMSLSDSPEADGPEGFTRNHTIDATVYIARTLISCGAAIAYGGDFRQGGYTAMLANLIQSYNQSASREAQDLHSYLAATMPLSEAKDLALRVHHLNKGEWQQKASLPAPPNPLPPPPAFPPAALYFSDMRRVMEDNVAARILLGGNIVPTTENGRGYGGRYPGVIEEAWWSLRKGTPLYVIGGFGGAAGIVAGLIGGTGPVPEALLDATWEKSVVFSDNARLIEQSPFTAGLGLPKDMAALASAITTLAQPHFASDAAAIAWNGLNLEENRLLLRTRDPVTITALVSKGLLQTCRTREQGLLQIELVNDSIGNADNLDVIAIATLDGVPLGGPGAALDQLTSGSATSARSRGHSLASLKQSHIDADWLYLASLGAPGAPEEMAAAVGNASRNTAELAIKHGFQRLGIVTFGGNLLSDVAATAATMIGGFDSLPRSSALVWYETDQDRFDQLQEALGKRTDVKLTTRRALTPLLKPATPSEPLILAVGLEGDKLSATLLPPRAGAAVSVNVSEFPASVIVELAAGDRTPSLAELQKRGSRLAGYLFGDQAAAILSQFQDSRLIIVHDLPSSRIPFEILQTAPDLKPALKGGITRKLSISGLGFERQIPKPDKKGKLKVLLISDPTGNLPGAAAEAAAVKAILEGMSNIDLVELAGQDATKARFSSELAGADVLHYCGHAFFLGAGEGESGLILADGEFTAADLRQIEPLPRMAFVNACQAGRVRGRTASNAAAFAELFLDSGIDAYLGTFWEVMDLPAQVFAETVYKSLAAGRSLEQATLEGRNALSADNQSDWANYILFGGGYFRLVAQQ